MFDVVDGPVVVEEGNDVYIKGEGEGCDDDIDDLFEHRGGGGLGEVGIGRHGNLEHNMEALAGIVAVGYAAMMRPRVVGLDFDVVLMSSTLFFEKGCDDAGGGVDTGRWISGLDGLRHYV